MLPAQCIYYDASQCQKDSQKQGGYCTANPDELRTPVGYGQYCMVTSQQVSLCVYLNRESCTAEATRQHGACYRNEAGGASGAPDPFAASGGPYTAPP